jgi:hypothetical protein
MPHDPRDEPDDYNVDSGDEPNTVHVPYEPPSAPPDPIVRPPDGTERPWPQEPEREPPEHAPENEPPDLEPEDSPEAP